MTALRGDVAKRCHKLGIETLGAIALRSAEIAQNHSRLWRRLASELGALPEDLALVDATDWLAIVSRALLRLRARAALVVRGRLGLDGPAKRLGELGAALDITRERVRQIERVALDQMRLGWATRIGARLETLVGPCVPAIEELGGRDELFRVEPTRRDVLGRFIDVVLACSVRTHRIGEHIVVSRYEPADIDAWMKAMLESARDVRYPLHRNALADDFALRTGLSVEVTRDLLVVMKGEWTCVGDRFVAFGTGRSARIVAMLRSSPRPLAVATIEKRCGHGSMPPESVLLGDAQVALRERLDGWDDHARRLSAECLRIMREEPSRQWKAWALLSVLASRTTLPSWCNAVVLAAILRDAPAIQSLGRGTFGLTTTSGPNGRIRVVDAVREELERAGKPLSMAVVLARVRARCDFSAITWRTAQPKQPWLAVLTDGRLALVPRDVPGGRRAVTRAIRDVTRLLRLWGRPLRVRHVALLLQRERCPAGQWDRGLLRAVLVHHSSLHVTRSLVHP